MDYMWWESTRTDYLRGTRRPERVPRGMGEDNGGGQVKQNRHHNIQLTPKCIFYHLFSSFHSNTLMYLLPLKELYLLPLDAITNYIILGALKKGLLSVIHL